MRGLEALFAVSQHISRTNGLASFFGALTETIARLTGAERAAFWTLRLDNTLVVQPEAFGFPEAVVARLQRVPVRFDAVEDVDDMVHGDPIWHVARRSCDDLPRRAPWLDVEGVSEGVVVPWRVGELRLGLLGVYDSRRPHGFSESDVRVARIAALAAGLVWQERQAARRLVEVERQQTGRLRAYADRMAALEKLKSNVLNLAAHELRGPLAVMRGYLSMLEDGSIEGAEEVARVRPILSAK
ncbi:MAG TPA: GAF domain-containing protein, partial [Candidatus Dormibacteraeota bacterium]